MPPRVLTPLVVLLARNTLHIELPFWHLATLRPLTVHRERGDDIRMVHRHRTFGTFLRGVLPIYIRLPCTLSELFGMVM